MSAVPQIEVKVNKESKFFPVEATADHDSYLGQLSLSIKKAQSEVNESLTKIVEEEKIKNNLTGPKCKKLKNGDD